MAPRERVRQIVETRRFQQVIIGVILVNAATLGLATAASPTSNYGAILGSLDRIALGIFVVELTAKLYAYRWRFFRDPWNCFDFLVVAVALLPATGSFAALRALRLLRILRLVSMVPSMRRVVATLLAAVPGAASIVGLLMLLIYVSAVMATTLFGEASPEHFGDLGQSLWTLFQVMTGEAWPEIAADVMDERPLAWIFFLVFILVSSFVVLNLFLAVMVSAMESVRDQEDSAEHRTEEAVLAEVTALRQEVAALHRLLEGDSAPQTRS